jgi:hypothetical protein
VLPFNFFKAVYLLTKMTVTLMFDNWWQHEDEPFVTNCSWLTATLCWGAWLFVGLVMSYLSLVLTFYLIPKGIAETHRVWRREGPPGICRRIKYFLSDLKELLKYYYGYIQGYSPDAYEEMKIEYERLNKTKNELTKRSKTWGQIRDEQFDETYELTCSVCLSQFKKSDKVV